MSATLYHFPTKSIRGLKIPLYTEEEIFITLAALNCFGNTQSRVTEKDLLDLEPVDVMQALYEAKYSNLFSFTTRQTIDKILKSIETIAL
jgi:hypothetical protein